MQQKSPAPVPKPAAPKSPEQADSEEYSMDDASAYMDAVTEGTHFLAEQKQVQKQKDWGAAAVQEIDMKEIEKNEPKVPVKYPRYGLS